jgi:hypothetical protein
VADALFVAPVLGSLVFLLFAFCSRKRRRSDMSEGSSISAIKGLTTPKSACPQTREKQPTASSQVTGEEHKAEKVSISTNILVTAAPLGLKMISSDRSGYRSAGAAEGADQRLRGY